jgi:hypothetical protein
MDSLRGYCRKPLQRTGNQLVFNKMVVSLCLSVFVFNSTLEEGEKHEKSEWDMQAHDINSIQCEKRNKHFNSRGSKKIV